MFACVLVVGGRVDAVSVLVAVVGCVGGNAANSAAFITDIAGLLDGVFYSVVLVVGSLAV